MDSDAEEKDHFKRIVKAFLSYRSYALGKVSEREKHLKSLPVHHQHMLSKYKSNLETIKACIEHNSDVLKTIIKDVETMFENVHHKELEEENFQRPQVTDLEKVKSTIRQFVRDWSEDGAGERKMCYQPIIDAILYYLPLNESRGQISVLVPGAGLGRLAYELAKRGYICQGNEFSLFMLFASNYVLNKCQGVNSMKLYPYVHQYSNNMVREDQVRPIAFPDVDPSDLPPGSQFSMAAGDFLEIYQDENSWDCVATCFFIDCANNVVEFIEAIYKIIKPGGYWVNLGPLLYHFEDQKGENSIEPSYEDIKGILQHVGFTLEKEETKIKTAYTENLRSMMKYEYESVFFVARKSPQAV